MACFTSTARIGDRLMRAFAMLKAAPMSRRLGPEYP